MRLNLKQLQAFVWVSDLGSFRGAADRLNTTQPNISARIAGLEAALNVTLMERDAGSVRLTAKGRDLLVHARQVLAAVDDLVTATGQAALVDGTLRLGVTELIVRTWLRDYLGALRAQFPNLAVELTVDLSANLEQGLAGRTLDLALQNDPFQRAMTGQVALQTYPLIWVAAPGLVTNGDTDVQTIAAHPILTHARGTRLYTEVSAHFSQARNINALLVPSSNLTACLHMAVNGMGIATLPATMVADELDRGTLVQLDYHWSPAPLTFFARFDADRAPAMINSAVKLAQRAAMDYKY